ncbi:nitrous oxide-stimulated promoter family protein [Vibrio sp. 10N.261.55.A7]|uniref:nitrous oxide-stimulated promoter family protein n=1 Tax=Vibrio sp. 10N.261.55.A7 TaxID=1880851 RepID=UPI000C8578B3|nr:nitrous oxide-stimulated promoter family protein [Vibrio sp. 10N.261.55.A7]
MSTKPSSLLQGSLLTEFRTVSAMMDIYCRDHHSSNGLCPDCSTLLSYAETKLDRCPYGQSKPTCNRCPIHCYKPEPKEQMRQIMRYAGPRMLLPHPILAIRHLLHERKAVPAKPLPDSSNRHQRQLNRNK